MGPTTQGVDIHEYRWREISRELENERGRGREGMRGREKERKREREREKERKAGFKMYTIFVYANIFIHKYTPCVSYPTGVISIPSPLELAQITGSKIPYDDSRALNSQP